MSRKIIGVTVGTTLPKPNFKQTDPTKGDYIRNKPDFDGLRTKVDEFGEQLSDLSKKIDNLDYKSGITSIDDGSGNIILQALHIPLSSSDDNQGNVTIIM